MNTFKPEAFFDTSQVSWKGFFNELTYVWEAVAALPQYIEKSIVPEILGEVEDGAWLEPGSVRLEGGSRVERGAIIRGPTIIGRNTVVRSGAYIRGHVMTGEGCMIGHGTELRQVLLLNRSNIPHQNCFFTSVVGNDVQIGGNTNTANRLFNGREVEIYVEIDGRKQIFPTGLNLFGVIIGDETGVGGNVLFNPGTIIGRQCQVYPKINVSGCITHNMIIRPKASPLEIIPKSGRKVK